MIDFRNVEWDMSLFRELVSCCSLYIWCFDINGELIESNCPYESDFLLLFNQLGCRDEMYQYAQNYSMPMQLSDPLGIFWSADFYKNKEKNIWRAYVIGPCFSTVMSVESVENALDHCVLNISLSARHKLLKNIQTIPAVSTILTNQLMIMLHYILTGDKIKISDISSQRTKQLMPTGDIIVKDRRKVWAFECNLLRLVREGNPEYIDALNNSSLISAGIPVMSKEPLRQAKDSVIVSISMSVRTAIEGGLSPDTAYSLGDTYIQSTESAESIEDIRTIHQTALKDLVERVARKKKQKQKYSKPVRNCCDYISLHLEKKLTTALLAEKIGYSEYYLSRKFKEEMGISLNEYIHKEKISHAKFLLRTTNDSINDIALRLGFCSRSHFGEVFRKVEGIAPAEYREQNN